MIQLINKPRVIKNIYLLVDTLAMLRALAVGASRGTVGAPADSCLITEGFVILSGFSHVNSFVIVFQ